MLFTKPLDSDSIISCFLKRAMIIKNSADIHWTKNFGDSAFSNRLVLPGRDGCRVKVTRFVGKMGYELNDICNETDETIYVESGEVRLEFNFRNDVSRKSFHHVTSETVVHIPAGEKYNLRVVRECALICMFSAAVTLLPDDN